MLSTKHYRIQGHLSPVDISAYKLLGFQWCFGFTFDLSKPKTLPRLLKLRLKYLQAWHLVFKCWCVQYLNLSVLLEQWLRDLCCSNPPLVRPLLQVVRHQVCDLLPTLSHVRWLPRNGWVYCYALNTAVCLSSFFKISNVRALQLVYIVLLQRCMFSWTCFNYELCKFILIPFKTVFTSNLKHLTMMYSPTHNLRPLMPLYAAVWMNIKINVLATVSTFWQLLHLNFVKI